MSETRRKRWTKPEALSLQETWQESGQNQIDFCKEVGIPMSTFSTWRRKLRDSGELQTKSQRKPKPKFVELPRPRTISSQAQSIEIITPRGFRLTLPANFAATDLRSVLSVIEPC